MPKRHLAVEVEFEDDFALLDFQENGWDTDLLRFVADWLAERLTDRVTVVDYLTKTREYSDWVREGFFNQPRPSEIAIAKVMQAEHPDKTHWQDSRERLERIYAEAAEKRAREAADAAELAAALEAEVELAAERAARPEGQR